MKVILALFATLTLTGAAVSQAPPRNVIEIERLCGEMDFRTPGPNGEAVPLGGVRLEIYAWTESFDCCDGAQALWKTTTGRDGSYKFGHVDAGQYWLVAHWAGKNFQLPIRFAPSKPVKGGCYLQGLEIDSEGNLKASIRALM